MRFSEFKIIKEAAEQPKFYSIGDSHAHAVGQMGGRDWVNLAIGGRSSTDSELFSNAKRIPRGATVLVSVGANDTANAAKRHVDTGGKSLIKNPRIIAHDVEKFVSAIRAQSAAKIIFLLFPNGPGRGPGLAKYYGGDYQEEVRDAIKGALGDIEIIDINGKPLTDGVHAGMSTYKEVANQVKSNASKGVTLGPVGATPGAPPTKDKAGQGASPAALATSPAALVLDVPTSRRGPAV